MMRRFAGLAPQPRNHQDDVEHATLAIKLEGVLPELMPVLDRLLAAVRASSSHSSGGSSACAGSSSGGGSGGSGGSSSGSNASAGQCASEGEMAEALWFLTASFAMLAEPIKGLQVVEPFSWHPQPGMHVTHVTSGSCSGLEVHPWQPHAAQLMGLLESYMRLPHAVSRSSAYQGLPTRQHELPVAMLALLCAVGDRAQPAALASTAIAAGAGSVEQQRLFGLLCSTLKRSSSLSLTQQTDAEECRLVAACAAARLSQLCASSSSMKSATGSVPASSCLSNLLPWLVLFGRCCLHWAHQLQWRHKGIPGMPAAAALQQAPVSEGSVMGRLGINSSSDVFFTSPKKQQRKGATSARPLFSLLLAALQAPLQDAGISAQMSAAGLNAGAVLSKALAAKVAVKAARVAKPDALIAAVKDLGEGLTSLPCAVACNNPVCSNMSEASEVQLVAGSQHKCSGCRTARYCGRECQAQHWKQHRPVCKALAAAAAAGVTGSAASAAGVVIVS
jgi:hypothetical protein